MADRFIDRIAELAGQTTRTLEQVATILLESGLDSQAKTLQTIARLHAQIAIDCISETQPIALERYNLPERMRKTAKEIEEISTDLMTRGKVGHSELSEAIDLINKALDKQRDRARPRWR